MAPNNEIFDKVGNVANDVSNTLSETLSNVGTKVSETIKETVKEVVLTTPGSTSPFVSHIYFYLHAYKIGLGTYNFLSFKVLDKI